MKPPSPKALKLLQKTLVAVTKWLKEGGQLPKATASSSTLSPSKFQAYVLGNLKNYGRAYKAAGLPEKTKTAKEAEGLFRDLVKAAARLNNPPPGLN